MRLPPHDNHWCRTLFSFRLDEEKVRISIVLSRSTEYNHLAYFGMRHVPSSFKHIRGPDHRYACTVCKKTFLKEDMYKVYKYEHHTFYLCSRECFKERWKKRQERYQAKQEIEAAVETCRIIRTHEFNMRGDPESINIKKFLNRHIECD